MNAQLETPALRRGWHWANAWLQQHRRIAAVVTLAIGALPAFYIGCFVARHGVEVPSMDDWEMAPLIAKAHTGELGFRDLFEQQEEARTIVPKLIFVLSAMGRHWDVRDQMMLSVVISVLAALGIYVLLRRSALSTPATAVCFWASVLLIFSPAQFELWLFASGFPSYIPALCVVGGLLVVATRWSLGAKFAICALFATISTFTLAHGLLAWGLTFPVVLAADRVSNWKRWLIGWAAPAAVSAAVYFHGYRKPAHLPDFAPAISALDYVQFFLAFLGGSFAYAADQQRMALAVGVGAVALALFLFAAIYTGARLRDAELVSRSLPWFALGLYAIGSGALATLGRVGFGHDYAISSRYVTFSLYLLVALVALGAVVGGAILRTQRGRWSPIGVVSLGLVLAFTGGWLFHSASQTSLRIMYSIAARNRLARSAIVFSPVLDTKAIIKRINYPAPEVAMSRAARLDELKLLRPRLVRSNRIASLQQGASNDQTASGWCDAVVPLDGNEIRASGWAALTGKGRPADCVLLAYQSPEGEWIAFAISNAVVRRRDVARMLGNRDQLWSGWTATFRRDAVPAGAPIGAWAVDIDVPQLYRLEQNAPELRL